MQAPNLQPITKDIFFGQNLFLIYVNEEPFCCVTTRQDAIALIRSLAKTLIDEKMQDSKHAPGTLEVTSEDTLECENIVLPKRLVIYKQTISRVARMMNGLIRVEATLRFQEIPSGMLRAPPTIKTEVSL